MNTTTDITLYQLSYSRLRTYLVAALFIVGNVALPQLCHLVPHGGLILLPIYFFTLVGAYKYGFTVGLTTAVLSPLVNCALFGMPSVAMLPVILVKSVILAVLAAAVAHRCKRLSLLAIAAVVVGYQLAGSLAEWGITGSAARALQDLQLGWPGIVLQVAGGYLVLRYLLKR